MSFSPLRFGVYAKDLSRAVSELSRATPMDNPFMPDQKMTITGAAYLADTIKAKIQKAKDRVSASALKTDAALDKLISAADHADLVSNVIEAEADDLMAQIGQFSNGAPDV